MNFPPASNLSLVVAAGSDHVARWSIRGASNHFTNEVCLAGCDHVSNTRDEVKHLANLLVPDSLFLDFEHQNLEDSTNVAVQEDFKLVKLGLAQGPCFCSRMAQNSRYLL
jgi:hypothetical protein